MTWAVAVLASGVTIDVSGACVDIQQRLRDWNAQEGCMQEGTEVHVAVKPQEGGLSLRVELKAPGVGAGAVERTVNSCEEAFNVAKFELEVGCVPPEVPATFPAQASASSAVQLEAFAMASSNYPEGYGLGGGGGLALNFDRLHLGAYAAWVQTAFLESDDVNTSSYHLRRIDFQVLPCLDILSTPVRMSPCLGVDVPLFMLDEDEVGKAGSDTLANAVGVDLGLVVTKPMSWGSSVNAGLVVRYAVYPYTLEPKEKYEELKWQPRRFEVNLRLGLTFDLWDFSHGGSTRSGVGAVARKGGVQSW